MKTEYRKQRNNWQPSTEFRKYCEKQKTKSYLSFPCLKQSYTVAALAAASGREKTTVCLQHRAGVQAAVKSA
jgi:hypothetical protein